METQKSNSAFNFMLFCASVALLVYAYATFVGEQQRFGPTTIDVQGEGEVLARPDIGMFSFSVTAKGDDAAAAQEQSAEAINDIVSYLEDEGIEEKDIKTQNYNLFPSYRYEERVCPVGNFCPPGERVIDGYEVTQSISVKVRDLDSAGGLISGVGERGATNISGLSFTIDDTDVLEEQARAAAIADAKAKADRLADELGVRIVRMVGFMEEGGQGGYFPVATRAMSLDMAFEEAAIAPELPVGENTIRKSVSITFEVK